MNLNASPIRRRPPFLDEEVPTEARARITWLADLYRIDQLTAGTPGAGGVYVVELNGKPIYVGETGSLTSRWQGRTAIYRELRLSRTPLDGFRVRVGRVTHRRRPATQSQRQGTERVLVRYLLKVKRFTLTNHRVRLPFTVGPGEVLVTNAGSRPGYLPKTIRRARGTTFELERRGAINPGWR